MVYFVLKGIIKNQALPYIFIVREAFHWIYTYLNDY